MFTADVPKLHFKRAFTNLTAVTRTRFRIFFMRSSPSRFVVSMPRKSPFQTRVNVIVGSNLRLSEKKLMISIIWLCLHFQKGSQARIIRGRWV